MKKEDFIRCLAPIDAPAESSGAPILGDVEAFLARFVAYPSEAARVAHTLWVAHTHAMEAWESTPRLCFLSPEPGSGKTRALEATALVALNPVEAVNVTPAYLFRKIGGDDRVTILHDEIDTVFGPKARENEELRGLLNAGHRRGAMAGRCVVRGKVVETEEISAFCAVALAGLGDLPDTILTRSIIIRMRRRAPGERVEAFRQRIHKPQGDELRERLAEWIEPLVEGFANDWPDMPQGVEDRAADVWEPLIVIADAAGGDWPRRARDACVTFVAAQQASTPSWGIRLLTDLREVFGDKASMRTEDILSALHELPESPWAEIKGKPLDARGLSRRLSPYGVKPKLIRKGESVGRGYTAEDLHDPWARYAPPQHQRSVTRVAPVTSEAADCGDVTPVTDVTPLRQGDRTSAKPLGSDDPMDPNDPYNPDAWR